MLGKRRPDERGGRHCLRSEMSMDAELPVSEWSTNLGIYHTENSREEAFTGWHADTDTSGVWVQINAGKQGADSPAEDDSGPAHERCGRCLWDRNGNASFVSRQAVVSRGGKEANLDRQTLRSRPPWPKSPLRLGASFPGPSTPASSRAIDSRAKMFATSRPHTPPSRKGRYSTSFEHAPACRPVVGVKPEYS